MVYCRNPNIEHNPLQGIRNSELSSFANNEPVPSCLAAIAMDSTDVSLSEHSWPQSHRLRFHPPGGTDQ